MTITIRILFMSFLPGDVSVRTNVIIGIGVGSAVLSMAGILIVMVMMCVCTVRKKGSGYIQGVCVGQSLLLTLGHRVGVLTKLVISHPFNMIALLGIELMNTVPVHNKWEL